MLRPASPCRPAGTLAVNAAVLNHSAGDFGPPLGSWPGTTSGRSEFALPSLQKQESLIPNGVYQYPICRLKMLVNCQPPRNASTKEFTPEPNLLPLPKGSKYTELNTNRWRASKSEFPYSQSRCRGSRKVSPACWLPRLASEALSSEWLYV